MSQLDELKALFDHMMHKRIDGITVDNEDVILVLEDGTNVSFYLDEDEDFSISYIMPQKLN